MNSALSRKIDISWHEINESLYLVAYRDGGKESVPCLIEYCTYLSELGGLKNSTIKNDIQLLKSALDYLLERGVEVEDITDQLIKEFRDSEVGRVMAAHNSFRDLSTAKRTVNEKLRRLYAFLIWYQSSHANIGALIGRDSCQVTYLVDREKLPRHSSQSVVGHLREEYGGHRIPVLFKRIGENSLNRHTRAATDDDVLNMRAYFKTEHTSYVALRNILILNVANKCGLRRGSINSLRCAQFSLEKLSRYRNKFPVCPDEQKFGRQNTFEIPMSIALQIVEFITGPRRQLLDEMGWPDVETRDRIFISARDGRPITDQHISASFGDAARSIGKKKGQAIHMLRFKYAEDQIVDEIESRIALGLDTSSHSITAAAAIKLGHSDPASVATYVSRSESKLVERHRALHSGGGDKEEKDG